jgi:hypothetical protein
MKGVYKLDINGALENAHDAINLLGVVALLHNTPPKFIKTCDFTPEDGEAVWVRHRNGAEYRMTYPFNHEDYPLWYPLPKD